MSITDSKPTNGLSTGEYAAIVIGCLLIIVIGLACVFRKYVILANACWYKE